MLIIRGFFCGKGNFAIHMVNVVRYTFCLNYPRGNSTIEQVCLIKMEHCFFTILNLMFFLFHVSIYYTYFCCSCKLKSSILHQTEGLKMEAAP